MLFFLLCNCAPPTAALLGPAITGAKTGNVLQAGLSYSSNSLIKNQTGKTTSEHIKTLLKINDNISVSEIDPKEEKKIFVKKNDIEIKASIKESTEEEYKAFLSSVKKILK